MRHAWFVLFFLLPTCPAWAGSYKCIDAAGKISFQQMPCVEVHGAIQPIHTSQITADGIRQTLDLYAKAINERDQRAQLSLLADDFILSIYDSDQFDYVRTRYRKPEVVAQREALRLFQRLGSGEGVNIRELQTGSDRHQVLVQALSGTGDVAMARLELALVHGQLVIQRWDAVR